MYYITYLYPAGIRGKGVSLKNTELYLPVRSQAQKGMGLIRGGGLVAPPPTLTPYNRHVRVMT